MGLTVGRGTPSVSGGGGSTTVLLSSDWSQGTGTADADLIENGKLRAWDAVGYGTNRLTVVSAAGHDMPAGMTNILRVTHPIGGQTYSQVQKFWSMPAVGETTYYRWFFRSEVADSESANTGGFGGGYHPLETPSSPGNYTTNGEIVWKNDSRGDGTFQWWIESQNDFSQRFSVGLNARSSPTYLPKFATLRFEMKLTRTAASSPFNRGAFDFRIYNEAVSSTVPIYDRNNMWYWDFNGGVNEGRIADGYGQDVHMLQNGFTCIETGTNGGNWTPTTVQYEYWGGFRVVRGGDWIGPYVPGES